MARTTSDLLRGVPHPALAGRSLLTLRHHPPEAVTAVLDLADRLKGLGGRWPALLAGRVVAVVLEAPSTRTRVSFESGIGRLGGQTIVLGGADSQLGRGETIGDTGKVLSRMADAIVLRTGAHERLEEMAADSSVPVVNGLTRSHHPCQALADAQTLRERFGELAGLPVTYVGDGNNVCTSLLWVGALTGMRVTCACPEGYRPDPATVAAADAAARERGGGARALEDPHEAVAGARAVYTDTWVSMGDRDAEERRDALTPYRVDEALMDLAAPDAVALHCLPAHEGDEITRAVLRGPRSAVWDQAENRMHAQAALLVHMLGGEESGAGP